MTQKGLTYHKPTNQHFSLGMAAHLGEKKCEFKPAVLHLDIALVPHPAHGRGVR